MNWEIFWALLLALTLVAFFTVVPIRRLLEGQRKQTDSTLRITLADYLRANVDLGEDDE